MVVAGPVTSQLNEPDDVPLVTDAAIGCHVAPASRLRSTRTRACAPSVCVHEMVRVEPTGNEVAVFGAVTVTAPLPVTTLNDELDTSITSEVRRCATTRMRPLVVAGPGAVHVHDRAVAGSAAHEEIAA